jgi:hypothetical protein
MATTTAHPFVIATTTRRRELPVTMRSLTLFALLLVGGCALFDVDDGDRYLLTRVNGVDLPVTLQQQTLPDGRTMMLIATSGRLTFYARGTYRMDVGVERRWTDATPDATFYVSREGAFTMLGDTAVQVRFRESGTWSRTNYRVLENGDLLRAVQGIAGTNLAVYDYRRP